MAAVQGHGPPKVRVWLSLGSFCASPGGLCHLVPQFLYPNPVTTLHLVLCRSNICDHPPAKLHHVVLHPICVPIVPTVVQFCVPCILFILLSPTENSHIVSPPDIEILPSWLRQCQLSCLAACSHAGSAHTCVLQSCVHQSPSVQLSA